MADILIRGIEFPQCCGDCPFQASRWTGNFCSAGQFMFGIDFDYRDKHPKCPLDPLPEGHGRLGDLDALMPDFVKARWEFFSDGDTFLRLLKNAPTIVPAEGCGEADKKTNCSDCGNRNTPVCKYCEHDAEGGDEDG